MLAFLRLVPLKDWLYAGIIAALLICFGLYTGHEREVGAARILEADTAALVKATAKAKAETDRLQAKAYEAEHAHDKEISDLRLYRATHPVHLGLCHPSGDNKPGLPATSGTDPSHAGTSPAPGDLQPVPSGDSIGESDIERLLDILAGKADSVSSQLREYQNR